MHRYRAFRDIIEVDRDLPELSPANGSSGYQIFAGQPAELRPEQYRFVYRWQPPGGREICRIARKDSSYLFTYPDKVDFRLEERGGITYWQHQDCSAEMLRHTLINQALPRLLAHEGRIMLHASAVSLAAGQCVLFLGDSGFGKSTLAASLLDAGATVLADDCVELFLHDGVIMAVGAYPGLRLREDSRVRAVPRRSDSMQSMAQYNGKSVLSLPLETQTAYEVVGCYRLNDPRQNHTQIKLQSLQGAEAMIGVLQGLFRLDPRDADKRRSEFAAISRLFGAGLQVSALAYPRSYAQLSAVHARLISAQEGLVRLDR